MNIEQIKFFNKYNKKIRVKINWPLLFEVGWRIEKYFICEVAVLKAKCIMPWYVAEGREVSFDYLGAKPLELKNIEEWLGILNPEKKRNEVIESFREDYSKRFRITFEIPAFWLPNERWLILDGNHRISAIALLEKPPSLKIKVQSIICTPFCETILPDLRHFKT